MKRWGWMIGLFAIVVSALIFAVNRRPTDDLTPFRPFATSEDHWAYKTPGGHATESVFIEFSQLSEKKSREILDELVRRDGWHHATGWQPVPTIYKGGTDAEDPRAMTISCEMWDENGGYVIEDRPLNTLQVLLLRIRKLGRDPIDHPKILGH